MRSVCYHALDINHNPSGDLTMSSKVAIVTGAGSGIGKHTTLSLFEMRVIQLLWQDDAKIP